MPQSASLLRNLRFVVFGFALAFFSSFGQTFFISLFGKEIREDFELSHSGFGELYFYATLASGLTIIWLGEKVDSMDLRRFSVLLCIGLAIACTVVSLAQAAVVLVLGLFLLRLTGQGLLSHTAMTSMARYFEEDRGKAMSIAGLGFPAGETVLPVLAAGVIMAIGWRQTWLAIAAVPIALGIPLVFLLLRGHQERHREHLQRLATPERLSVASSSLTQRQWTRGEALLDIRFHLILPVVMAPGFIVTGLFFHHEHMVDVKGWDPAVFPRYFAVFAATQLPSGLLAGPLVDRWSARRLVPVFLLPLTASLVVLALSDHALVAPVFMGLAGITCGIASPIVGAMWAEVYGVRHLGAIRAVVTGILVFGTAASPVLMGWMIDGKQSIETIAWWCAAYTVVGTLVATVVRPGPRTSPAVTGDQEMS